MQKMPIRAIKQFTRIFKGNKEKKLDYDSLQCYFEWWRPEGGQVRIRSP